MLSNTDLNGFRKLGDALADAFLSGLPVHEIFQSTPASMDSAAFSAWKQSTAIGSTIFEKKSCRAGQRFYEKNRASILFVLGFMSLPYCYAAADGARVIFYSDKMRNNPLARLKDTALFVDAVCRHSTPAELIDKMVDTVRWKHAQVRNWMQKQAFWNPDWGMPINQEDMAGTNLAFSVVVLRGLRKLGVAITPQEVKSFFALWHEIGTGLGISNELNPSEIDMGLLLESAIKSRHFQVSDHGVALTRQLAQTLNQALGVGDASKIMAGLLEPDVAEVLSLQPVSLSPIQQTLINTFLQWKSF
jgi:hypothetical protein